MLRIFNTISNKKEKFLSFIKNKVNIYVCGVTTSNYCHVGHIRTFYFFDILLNYLKYLGYDCKYIRNITDIDNKIIFNSIKKKKNINELSFKMINCMFNDFKKFDLKLPNLEPKLTDNINFLIKSIVYLLNKNYAYISDNGDVLFCYDNFSSIYKYSFFKKSLSNDDCKDFVLWKLNKINDNYGWMSPWGFGRPGWHIGCSVISNLYLNNIVDIHGGGSDLIFPHHENELILSKCLFNIKYYIKFWIHTGLVIFNNNKMSKSSNNFFLYKLLRKYSPEVIKFYLMSKHYRKNLNYNINNLDIANKSFNKLYLGLYGLNLNLKLNNKDLLVFKEFDDMFFSYINNDFNISSIYKLLFLMLSELNKFKNKNFNLASKIGIKMKFFANFLGLLKLDIKKFLTNGYLYNKDKYLILLKKINYLIEKRNIERKKNNWKKADLYKKELLKFNVSLIDKEDFITEWFFLK